MGKIKQIRQKNNKILFKLIGKSVNHLKNKKYIYLLIIFGIERNIVFENTCLIIIKQHAIIIRILPDVKLNGAISFGKFTVLIITINVISVAIEIRNNNIPI